MKAAVEDGVDCLGYLSWSCIDLVSAGTGEMEKRYVMVIRRRWQAAIDWIRRIRL